MLADVAPVRHTQKALELGVDGLVLLTADSGGKTGWANPFDFVHAVREFFDGPIVLAGGLSDGVSLHAAQALGATLPSPFEQVNGQVRSCARRMASRRPSQESDGL